MFSEKKNFSFHFHDINASPSSAAYMSQWIGSTLVQIMTYRLFRRQTIIQTDVGLLWIETLRTNFSEILIKKKSFIHENASEYRVWNGVILSKRMS